MKKKKSNRIRQEQQVVELMIRLYCRHHEGHDALCPACTELLEYARRRLEHCRWGIRKPTCRQCPHHCYAPQQRERMRQIMRWAGPRMLLYHPLAAIRHMFREW